MWRRSATISRAGESGETPAATSAIGVPDGMPGGALSVSADGMQDGIVWASMPNQADATAGIHRGSLVAFDATNLRQLWADPCVFYFAKFTPPTVVNGRVYLATFAQPVLDPAQVVPRGAGRGGCGPRNDSVARAAAFTPAGGRCGVCKPGGSAADRTRRAGGESPAGRSPW